MTKFVFRKFVTRALQKQHGDLQVAQMLWTRSADGFRPGAAEIQ
jgi:hypothetical protein